MASKVPLLTLSNGRKIPQLGLGTWKSKPGEVTQAVKDAIDVGYRHIDGAFVYGNEHEVGEGIKSKISEGVVKREDLFVTSKLWNTFHSKDKVLPACKKTLELLGLDYVDLYLMHWPMGYKEGGALFETDSNGKQLFSEVDYLEAWEAMEKCSELGLAKSIGVSNFNSQQLSRLLEVAKIKPVVNQVECHPYLNQKKLIDFCSSKGIHVTAYSPLGSPDRPWAKPGDPLLLDDPKITSIAKKHEKSSAQVLLLWQIQRNVSVIPKSVTKQRIIDNFDLFDFKLSDDEVAVIDGMECNGRFVALSLVTHHPYFPFGIEF